jgi:hypothetical protein
VDEENQDQPTVGDGSGVEGGRAGGEPVPGDGGQQSRVDPVQVETGPVESGPVESGQSAAGSGPAEKGQGRGSGLRRTVAGLLVVLFAILLPLTYVVAWTHYVVLTTRGFEKTVVPIGTDPRVTSAVAATLTDQIFSSLNAQQRVANALPPKADFLAGPITEGAKGYVQDAVNTALQSSQFQTLWKQAVDFAHTQLLSVLKGNNQAVSTTNGQVVLNLVPIFNAALQNMEGFISGVVGHNVNLPSISSNEIPASACETIGNALNREVPSTCGQIPLFPADRLTQARHVVRIFNGVLVLLFVLTAGVAALALWLSRRRRRTLLQLSVAGLLGLVVIRRVVDWVTNSLVDTGLPANKSARQAILTHLFHQYFSISRWLILGLIVAFVAALLTGPYGWAVALRREVGNLAEATWGKARDDRTIAWVRAHIDLLRIAGAAVAVLLLIVISVSWVGFLVIAVLLAAYEIGLQRIGRSGLAPPSETSPGPPAAGPPDEATARS